MSELNASIKLDEWLFKNEVSECVFVSLIGHVSNDSVYGSLFKTEKGFLFQRHKWIEVNKGKTPPRVCAEMQYTCKFVTDDVFQSFKRLNNMEYMFREALDMKTV